MNYIAPRNMTVASLSGRSVAFVKGEPTYAPSQMHAELVAVGIVPAEELPEPPPSEGPVEPTVPAEREAAIFAAFEKIALKNERTDFTANGNPHGGVVAKVLGWSLGGKELNAAWQKFSLAKSGV